jgi:hypothetical protein
MKPKLLIASVLLALAMLTVNMGDAWAWRGGYGYRGGYGGYGHGWPAVSGSVSRSNGYAMGTRSFQYRGGYGFNRTFNRGCSGGSCSRTATTTTNSGKTWSRSGSGSKTANSANWQRNATGPSGSTVNRGGSCTTGSGCTGSATTVGSQGNTWTQNRTATPDGQGGVNATATFTGPNGTVTRTTH